MLDLERWPGVTLVNQSVTVVSAANLLPAISRRKAALIKSTAIVVTAVSRIPFTGLSTIVESHLFLCHEACKA